MDKKVSEFTKEERAAISKDFRNEIQLHGLGNAILQVVSSQSDKTPVRKTVFVQQCRKPNFAKQFRTTCQSVIDANPSLAQEVLELRRDVFNLAQDKKSK